MPASHRRTWVSSAECATSPLPPPIRCHRWKRAACSSREWHWAPRRRPSLYAWTSCWAAPAPALAATERALTRRASEHPSWARPRGSRACSRRASAWASLPARRPAASARAPFPTRTASSWRWSSRRSRSRPAPSSCSCCRPAGPACRPLWSATRAAPKSRAKWALARAQAAAALSADLLESHCSLGEIERPARRSEPLLASERRAEAPAVRVWICAAPRASGSGDFGAGLPEKD